MQTDALVIGAGPAGSATAILLAQAGWRVVIVEQHAFPRRKVCGECIAAGNLKLLDRLGVGAAFRWLAGAELRRVAWMSGASTVVADLPPCEDGPYAYGRALGRDTLDGLLLERARTLGVVVLQPARVIAVSGTVGRFVCDIDVDCGAVTARSVHAHVVVDAHGSWERPPEFRVGDWEPAPEFRVGDGNRPAEFLVDDGGDPSGATRAAGAPGLRSPRGRGAPLAPLEWRPAHRAADLLAFKANFTNATLAVGTLPVLSFAGGYGGMVTTAQGRTTLACCIRRDALHACRSRLPGTSAGAAVEALLRRSCRGVRDVMAGARLEGAWLAAGPIRPGIRTTAAPGVFRVGNAAGETHPLIGEGISMGLQSAALLAHELTRRPIATLDAGRAATLQEDYAREWRGVFRPRLRLAALYAHIAMRPALAAPARALLRRRPALLTVFARLAGKARRAAGTLDLTGEVS